MDKEGTPKGICNVSPTLLTPCRPVGLRRKRSTGKTSSSDSVNLSNLVSSPSTPVIKSSLKTQRLATPCTTAQNVQGRGVNSGWKNIDGEDHRNAKRRCMTPCSSTLLKRKIAQTSTSSWPATPSLLENKLALIHDEENNTVLTNLSQNCDNLKTSGTATPSLDENKLCIINNEENNSILTDVSQNCDNLKNSGTCQSTIILDESLAKREITSIEINALKEKIASKEKKLKELKLAALYKKKHDPKHVAKEIDDWLRGCSEALYDLQSELAKRGQSFSLTQILKTLGIPPHLVDIEEDSSE